MIAAGYEATARLLFWACYLVALDQAEQDRLRAEITAFPPHHVSKLDDLQNWPRLRQALLEALRLYPPTPFMTRDAVADDVVSGEPVILSIKSKDRFEKSALGVKGERQRQAVGTSGHF
jgi:cytochrome P450